QTTTTTTVPPGTSTGTVAPGSTLQSLLAAANQDLDNAEAALKQGNLAQYQADVDAARINIQKANALSPSAAGGSTTTTTKPAISTATTTVPGH
ncbi:MAG TPA: hypothetical protein VFH70_05045, partial [Acidimicrobiales bacterium]|nr:hypothetical protein [Acidimicrobiales bacterium]